MDEQEELIELICGCKGKICLTGGFDVFKFCNYHDSLKAYDKSGKDDILMRKETGR